LGSCVNWSEEKSANDDDASVQIFSTFDPPVTTNDIKQFTAVTYVLKKISCCGDCMLPVGFRENLGVLKHSKNIFLFIKMH
jgi:hypothetical protein